VLFDNRTKDTRVQAGQRKELFDSIDSIMIDHQRRPFSEQMHPNIKVVSVITFFILRP
jgi:hypothetical protein